MSELPATPEELLPRVRQALEREFGELSEVEMMSLLARTVLTLNAKRAKSQPPEARGFRKPTTLDAMHHVIRSYPKSIEAAVHELSVYRLIAKSNDYELDGFSNRMGVGLAIVAHIIEAGELK